MFDDVEIRTPMNWTCCSKENHEKPLDLGAHYSQTKPNMADLFHCYELKALFFHPNGQARMCVGSRHFFSRFWRVPFKDVTCLGSAGKCDWADSLRGVSFYHLQRKPRISWVCVFDFSGEAMSFKRVQNPSILGDPWGSQGHRMIVMHPGSWLITLEVTTRAPGQAQWSPVGSPKNHWIRGWHIFQKPSGSPVPKIFLDESWYLAWSLWRPMIVPTNKSHEVMPMFDAETLLFLVSPCFTLIWVPQSTHTLLTQLQSRSPDLSALSPDRHRLGHLLVLDQPKMNCNLIVEIHPILRAETFWKSLDNLSMEGRLSRSPVHHYSQHDRLQIMTDILPAIKYISLKKQSKDISHDINSPFVSSILSLHI